MPCQGLVFGESLVPVSRALCFLVSITVTVIQISSSYSILFFKLPPLMVRGTHFLVLFSPWLDISVFQHAHSWMGGGKVIREVETQDGLYGGCSSSLVQEPHTCNCIKTRHVPSTLESSHQENLFQWPAPLKNSDLGFMWSDSQSNLSALLEMCF